jgi:oligopeptide transport system substrate-binding protein
MKKFQQLIILFIFSLAIAILFLATGCPIPQAQEVLNLSDSGPITLDPAVSSDSSSHAYIMQIFSGLVAFDDNLNPVPDIAERWQRSQDDKTYTFFLRKGVKFHDGKEVTAQDFKFSWERACNPKTGSQTAAMYLNDITGAKDVIEGRSKEISGLEVIDNYTITVTIDAPKAYFLAKLSYPTAFVVDEANVAQGEKWWRKPNGTGPFKLKEWQEGQVLVLESNKLYYQQPPRINQIDFQLLSGTPLELYETGKIDVAQVYTDYIERATDKKGPFYKELTTFPELSLNYIGFNVQKPPFDDANVRNAFCHAVDKERVIKIIMKGTVVNANGIIPPGMPGNNENLTGVDYNIVKAKSLIANSKYKSVSEFPPIKITVSGWGGDISPSLGAIIQDWHENLGVDVTVRQIEPEIFLYYLTKEADEMFMLGWVADYPDPQDFLENLFRTGTSYNAGNYSNHHVDELLDQAAIEPDNTTRINLYHQAEKIILDEAACFPLWYNTSYILTKPYVKNYKLNPMGIPALSQAFIER